MRFITLFSAISILSSQIYATQYKYLGDYNSFIYPRARAQSFRSKHGNEAVGKSGSDDSLSQNDKSHLVIIKMPRNNMYLKGGRFGVMKPLFDRRVEPAWVNRYYDDTFNSECARGKMMSKEDVMMMHPTINTDLNMLYNAKKMKENPRSHVVKKPSSYVRLTKDSKRPIYVQVDRSKKPLRIIPPYQRSRYPFPSKSFNDNQTYRRMSILDISPRNNRSVSLRDKEKLYSMIAPQKTENLKGFARESFDLNDRKNDKPNIYALLSAEKAKRLKHYLDKLYNRKISDLEGKNAGYEHLVPVKKIYNAKDIGGKNEDSQYSTSSPELTKTYEDKKSKPVVINLLESIGNKTLQSNFNIDGEKGETSVNPEKKKLNSSVVPSANHSVEGFARSAMTEEYGYHKKNNEPLGPSEKEDLYPSTFPIEKNDDESFIEPNKAEEYVTVNEAPFDMDNAIESKNGLKHYNKPDSHRNNYGENNDQPSSIEGVHINDSKKEVDDDYKSGKPKHKDKLSIIVDIKTRRKHNGLNFYELESTSDIPLENALNIDEAKTEKYLKSGKHEENVFSSNTPAYIESSPSYISNILTSEYSSKQTYFDKNSTDTTDHNSFTTVIPDKYTYYLPNIIQNNTLGVILNNNYNDSGLNNAAASIDEEHPNGRNDKVQENKYDHIISVNQPNERSHYEQNSDDSRSKHKSYKHLQQPLEPFQNFLWNFANNEESDPRNSDGKKRGSPQYLSHYVPHDFVQGQFVRLNPYDKYNDEFDKSISTESNLLSYYKSLFNRDSSSINTDGKPAYKGNDQEDSNYFSSDEKMKEAGYLRRDKSATNSSEREISKVLNNHISNVDASATPLTSQQNLEDDAQLLPNGIATDNDANVIDSFESKLQSAQELNLTELSYLNELPIRHNFVDVSAKPLSPNDSEVSEIYESIHRTSPEWGSSLDNLAIDDSSESITLDPTILNESEPNRLSKWSGGLNIDGNPTGREEANSKQEFTIDINNNNSIHLLTSLDDSTKDSTGDININHLQTFNNYEPVVDIDNSEYTFPTAQTLTTTEWTGTEEPNNYNSEKNSIHDLNALQPLTKQREQYSYFNNNAIVSNELLDKYITNSPIIDINNAQITESQNNSEVYTHDIEPAQDSGNNMSSMKIMDLKSNQIDVSSRKPTLNTNEGNIVSEPDAMSVDEFLKKTRSREEPFTDDKGIIDNNNDNSLEMFTDQYEVDTPFNPYHQPGTENVENSTPDDTIFSNKANYSIPQEDMVSEDYFETIQNVTDDTTNTKNNKEVNEDLLNKQNGYLDLTYSPRQANNGDLLGQYWEDIVSNQSETDNDRQPNKNRKDALPMEEQQHNSISEIYEPTNHKYKGNNVQTDYVKEYPSHNFDSFDTHPSLQSKEYFNCAHCSNADIYGVQKEDSKKMKNKRICFTLEENNGLKDEDLLKILHTLIINKISGPFSKKPLENGVSYSLTDNLNNTDNIEELYPKNFLNIIAQYINKTDLNREVNTNNDDSMERNERADEDSAINSDDLSEQSSEHKAMYNEAFLGKEKMNARNRLLPTSDFLHDGHSTATLSSKSEVPDL